jgi:putative aminopeptidase FrvX
MLNRDTLRQLLACHSTSGDEAEVRDVLVQAWQRAGLNVTHLGEYAVHASLPARSRKPILLITAHMDSPGFTIDRMKIAGGRAGSAGMTSLGHPSMAADRVAGVLKTCDGQHTPVTIRKIRRRGGEVDFRCEPVAPARRLPEALGHGDRVCYASAPEFDGDQISSPFLDNRLGCWLLAELAPRIAAWKSRWQIVLGATSSEEMGGMGAPVLARQVRPDFVIVLDATYEALDQDVRLGNGPVLTLSDASVLLSPARRDRVKKVLATAGVALQTEVYNYSGTDARAFPQQGLASPVLALLLATTGNHSPRETADLRDAEHLVAALEILAREEHP